MDNQIIEYSWFLDGLPFLFLFYFTRSHPQTKLMGAKSIKFLGISNLYIVGDQSSPPKKKKKESNS